MMRLRNVFCLVFAILVFFSGMQTVFAENYFEIHFLDVGQGDAAIILCNGESLMIDGGAPSCSSLIYSYLVNDLGLTHIDYMISTHPHDDHVGGLSAALNACTVGKIYSPVTTYESKPFSSLTKYANAQDIEITVPVLGESFQLGSASVEFLSPNRNYDIMNDNSIIVRIEYGDTSFLFTGDAGSEAQHDVIGASHDISSTLYKVGHHGSESGTTDLLLYKVLPQYAIISVGKDNSYGHPHEQVINSLLNIGATVYRTDECGHIICYSDGKTLSFCTEKQPSVLKPSDFILNAPTATYIGNSNSKKFHYADCSSVDDMKEENKVEFDSKEVALAQGYIPCKRCNP